MTYPLVSIVIPTYNALKTLPFALGSLLVQTYENWECIIVNDGSMDRTFQVISKIASNDCRFKVIDLIENYGRAVARQTAIEETSGKYLAMVDADDWIYPNKIKDQVQVLESKKELVLVGSGMTLIDSSHRLIGLRCPSYDYREFPALNGPKSLHIMHATSLIRIDAAKAAGYDFKFTQTEDTDFLLRVLIKESSAVIGKAMYAYTEDNHSTKSDVLIKTNTDLIKIYSKYIKRYPVRSSFQIIKAYFKSILIRSAKYFDSEKTITRYRERALPTEKQLEEFNVAHREMLKGFEHISKIIKNAY